MRAIIDVEKIKELAKEDLSCAEIARKLDYKEISVWTSAKRNNIKVRNGKMNRIKLLSDIEKSILVGTVLGDGCIRKENTNSRICWSHSLAQKEYAIWKSELFKTINFNSYIYTANPDKRTKKRYSVINVTSETNNCFNEFYHEFYKDNKKKISFNLVDKYYNDLSLAIHFMDDGHKDGNTYKIATMSFSRDEIELFTEFLYKKFKLSTTIDKAGNIRIRTASARLFYDLVSPYIQKELLYKLVHVKLGEFRGTPEVDNPELSL